MELQLRSQRKLAVMGAVGASLLALPVFGASPADAAIAGANPTSFTGLRPNLRTVSVSGNKVNFCFDKTLSPNSLSRFDFRVGGYRSDNYQAVASTVNLLVSNTNCVQTSYLVNDVPDLNSATFGRVEAGAVTALGGFGLPNIADSTTLTTSKSISGTAGHTTGPDLQSVTIDATNNRIVYNFDQGILENNVAAANQFFFYDVGGTLHSGNTATAFENGTVEVSFTGADNVQTAVIGVVNQGVVTSRDATPGNPGDGFTSPTMNPSASVAVPTTGGRTARPDLTATVLASPNQVDFFYDDGVALASQTQFFVYTSNGQFVRSTGATVLPGNKVRATFPAVAQQFQEEFVFAAANPGAVVDLNGAPATFGGLPVGGNVGAQAAGFTNAPDAFGVTFDNASGTAVITFDQRIDPARVDATQFRLYAADGSIITQGVNPVLPLSAVVGTSTGPAPTQLTLQYTPSQLAVAKAIGIRGTIGAGAPAVFTYGGAGFTAAGNIPQALSPSASASAFSSARTVYSSYAKKAKKSYSRYVRKSSKKSSRRR